MNFFRKLFSRKTVDQNKLTLKTAQAVLNFLTYGLIYGAQSLRTQYRPETKVNEFVAVSEEILCALKKYHDQSTTGDAVLIHMHVNDRYKQITLKQSGNGVTLTLDDATRIIDHITLWQLYESMCSDILRQGDIYGKKLQSLATSCLGQG